MSHCNKSIEPLQGHALTFLGAFLRRVKGDGPPSRPRQILQQYRAAATQSAINNNVYCIHEEETSLKTRKQILDYPYTEVLDTKTRELIRVACAIAVNCPD